MKVLVPSLQAALLRGAFTATFQRSAYCGSTVNQRHDANQSSGRQPILADEVQTFKALITIHKVLQEGHPSTLRDAMANRSWIDSLSRSMSGEGLRGYGPLIKEYVNFLLAKLTFHQQHPDFNGTFEYEEYISLKGINDPNEGYETISDLMMLQDRIEQFQKLIFSHFRSGGNNECRISALVPLVQESYGIYKFITSMLRAMHTSKEIGLCFSTSVDNL